MDETPIKLKTAIRKCFHQAGIEVDDKIVSTDGKPTKGLTREALLTLLDAPKYTLAILRPGGTTMLQVEPKKHAALQSALSR